MTHMNSKDEVVDCYNMPVNWMMVSFLSLTWQEQMKYFAIEPLRKGDPRSEYPSKDILNQLARSILEVNFEFDFFDDDRVHSLVNENHGVVWSAWQNNEYFETFESFSTGDEWNEIRDLSRKLLEVMDLGFYPPPLPIDFDCLVETVDPED